MVKQILHVIVEYPGPQPVEAAVEVEPLPVRLKAFEIRTVRLAK